MVTNEQAEQELYHLICTHPTMQKFRAQMRKLIAEGKVPSELSDLCEHSLVEFLKSDDALGSAVKRSGIDPFSTVQEVGIVQAVLRKTEEPNVLTIEVPQLPAGVRLVPVEARASGGMLVTNQGRRMMNEMTEQFLRDHPAAIVPSPK